MRSDALNLLEALQREARLVDFLQEPLAGYEDAQIGAAVRDLHRQCASVLERMFALKPIETAPEGAMTEVGEGFDPARVHLSGNLSGPPPFRGKLCHHGWEATRCDLPAWNGHDDAILGRLEGPAASAQTGWGGNRGGYEDPRAQALINTYRASTTLQEQFDNMKAISDFVVNELPIMPLYYVTEHIGARKGVQAFDDYDGGEEAAQYYGTFTRNAYLWDVE